MLFIKIKSRIIILLLSVLMSSKFLYTIKAINSKFNYYNVMNSFMRLSTFNNDSSSNSSTVDYNSKDNTISKLTKIAVIGSGNFGTAIARRLAINREHHYPNNNSTIKMWVYEEVVDGRNLTDIINDDHINTKYLPNVLLPSSIVALSDLKETCYDADIIIFILSHKHLPKILNMMKGSIKQNAIGASLIKGVDFTESGPSLISSLIQKELGLKETAVVMGANLASDVAYDRFVETTVASENITTAATVAELLECSYLKTQLSNDVSTVEYCGALKNIVAIGAGLCDGMGLGASTKAALLRQGIQEMCTFCNLFDSTGNHNISTLMKSCGIADVIATSSGGRNRLCSSAYAQRVISDNQDIFSLDTNSEEEEEIHEYSLEIDTSLSDHGNYSVEQLQLMASLPSGQPIPKDPWQSHKDAAAELWMEIEAELLQGQVLQGVDTCREVVKCLQATGHIEGGRSDLFPLFNSIHGIACEGHNINTLFNWQSNNNNSK